MWFYGKCLAISEYLYWIATQKQIWNQPSEKKLAMNTHIHMKWIFARPMNIMKENRLISQTQMMKKKTKKPDWKEICQF